MITKHDLVQDWLPRYTGMPLDRFGNYVLLTNFRTYINNFAEKFGCQVFAGLSGIDARDDGKAIVVNAGHQVHAGGVAS